MKFNTHQITHLPKSFSLRPLRLKFPRSIWQGEGLSYPTEAEYAAYAKSLTEMNAGLYNAAAAYTNLVTAGGYAGAFAVWNFVQPHLSPTARMWIALLLGVSLTVFVSWNVFTMIYIALERMKFSGKLQGLEGRNYMARHEELEAGLKAFQPWFVRAWGISVTFTVLTAGAAMILLICNCGAYLLA